MKGCIDSAGMLVIERAGKYKDQMCPADQSGYQCGDWCPRFEEIRDTGPMSQKVAYVAIRCCPVPVIIDIIEDHRTDPRP